MKWSIGGKISSGFALGLAILVVLGVISYRDSTGLIASADWVTHTYQVLTKLDGIIKAMDDIETGGRGFVITGVEAFFDPYTTGSANVGPLVKEVRQLTSDNPDQQKRLDALEPLIATRLDITKAEIDARRTAGFKAAQEMVASGQGKKIMDQIRQVIAAMADDENRLLKERDVAAKASAGVTVTVILYGIPLAFVLLAVVALLLIRNISIPLASITRTAEKIARGDLQGTLELRDRQDEIGLLSRTFRTMTVFLQDKAESAKQIAAGNLTVRVSSLSDSDVLGKAFTDMVQNLRSMTRELQEGIGMLGTSASEILATTTQIASGATETATGVSETITTVEEVKQTAQVASQKAKSVMDEAQRSVQISQAGRKSVEETLAGMDRIREQMEFIAGSIVRLSEQSQAIGEIIATVNDLAEQSNLLAVNAGIEAAKAGEQGKGFAVVAQEVKSLAAQSKQATAQVRGILGEVQKATSAAVMATEQGSKVVEAGVKQSAEVSEAIRQLGESIAEAAQSSTQIAASGQQQVVGMDQVAQAMESIKVASAQNVAGTKQAEAAAQQLHELGERLKQLVARYRLEEHGDVRTG
ncbi:MAG TPA: CHASE3 domain-containing protein [Spirochaetia bacterium]|nr:CHASE3 domain-containing protein [Spirochaetia bacterium]